MAEPLEPVLYRGVTVPTNTNTVWLPHWVFNVKSSFTAKGKVNADRWPMDTLTC
jgi:hypothetical protein